MPPRPSEMAVGVTAGKMLGGGRPQDPHLCADPSVCPFLSQRAAGVAACPWEKQMVAGR